jgi:hypothetical protein
MPIATADHNAHAELVGLHAVAVEPHLMYPAVAGADWPSEKGTARRNETELVHGLRR